MHEGYATFEFNIKSIQLFSSHEFHALLLANLGNDDSGNWMNGSILPREPAPTAVRNVFLTRYYVAWAVFQSSYEGKHYRHGTRQRFYSCWRWWREQSFDGAIRRGPSLLQLATLT